MRESTELAKRVQKLGDPSDVQDVLAAAANQLEKAAVRYALDGISAHLVEYYVDHLDAFERVSEEGGRPTSEFLAGVRWVAERLADPDFDY